MTEVVSAVCPNNGKPTRLRSDRQHPVSIHFRLTAGPLRLLALVMSGEEQGVRGSALLHAGSEHRLELRTEAKQL